MAAYSKKFCCKLAVIPSTILKDRSARFPVFMSHIHDSSIANLLSIKRNHTGSRFSKENHKNPVVFRTTSACRRSFRHATHWAATHGRSSILSATLPAPFQSAKLTSACCYTSPSTWSLSRGSFLQCNSKLHAAMCHHASRQFCSVSRTCWNCQSTLSTNFSAGDDSAVFFCHDCSAILPVDNQLTYFQIMQCEQRYDLDVDQLTQTFRSLQRQLHPDKYSIKPKIEQNYSAEQSSAVNKAYSTLLKPLSRGLYLLELNGYSIEENDSSVEPEFLMEIMEINEELAETEDKETVRQIRAKNKVKLTELIKDLSKAFTSNDIPTARDILVYLKYYANIEDKAKEILGTDA